MTVRVGVIGAAGRMGRQIVHRVQQAPNLELVAALEVAGSRWLGHDAGLLASGVGCGVVLNTVDETTWETVDVAIDFSTPEALFHALPSLRRVGLVVGTTGLGSDLVDRLQDHAAEAPQLVAANFSTGVTLLLDLVARAASALPDFDLEIVEAHHNQKRDAPSGTALALGRAAAEARGVGLDEVAVHGRSGYTGPRVPGSIGFHAVRGGGIVGQHEVILATNGEVVRIAHEALDRGTFAEGAVRAAAWLAGKAPGRYTMRDVLGLTGT